VKVTEIAALKSTERFHYGGPTKGKKIRTQGKNERGVPNARRVIVVQNTQCGGAEEG